MRSSMHASRPRSSSRLRRDHSNTLDGILLADCAPAQSYPRSFVGTAARPRKHVAAAVARAQAQAQAQAQAVESNNLAKQHLLNPCALLTTTHYPSKRRQDLAANVRSTLSSVLRNGEEKRRSERASKTPSSSYDFWPLCISSLTCTRTTTLRRHRPLLFPFICCCLRLPRQLEMFMALCPIVMLALQLLPVNLSWVAAPQPQTPSSINCSQKQMTLGPCQRSRHHRSPNLFLLKRSSRPNLHQLVLWCSWLSLLSNTQAVPGSNPGGIIAFACAACVLLALKERGAGSLKSGRLRIFMKDAGVVRKLRDGLR